MPRSALILALFAACSPPAWSHKAALAELEGALACDFGETRWMADGGRWDRGWHEMNPVLGRHPSVGAIGGYLAIAGVVAIVAYPILPRWARSVTYFGLAALETANVATNNHNGVCGI